MIKALESRSNASNKRLVGKKIDHPNLGRLIVYLSTSMHQSQEYPECITTMHAALNMLSAGQPQLRKHSKIVMLICIIAPASISATEAALIPMALNQNGKPSTSFRSLM